MADLERLLQTVPCEGQRFIVTDGVFSMDGDICPLPALAALKKDYGACLIVDDAHASGVIGRTGRGTAEYFRMAGIDVQVGTLSKAFGAEGGIHRGKPGNLRLSAEYIAAFYFLHSHFRGHGSGGLSGSSLVKSGSGEISGPSS